jgi:7 transmembrane receptor (rhodopsin family)
MATTQLMMLTFSIDVARVNTTVEIDQRPGDDQDVDNRTVLTVFAELIVVTVISTCIVVSNVVNLAVLMSLGTSMPWATRFFLINLSVSDLLVGVIACAPAIIPAATGRWIYGSMWCQVSGLTHGTSVTISIWSISMVGLHR